MPPKGSSAHFYSPRRVGDGISNYNHKGKKYDYEHSEPYSLVMFNRDGMRHLSVSPHNIYETMSRSRKRMPGSTWCCCKSQKKGKQASSRKFRRKAHNCMANSSYCLFYQFSFKRSVKIFCYLSRRIRYS